MRKTGIDRHVTVAVFAFNNKLTHNERQPEQTCRLIGQALLQLPVCTSVTFVLACYD